MRPTMLGYVYTMHDSTFETNWQIYGECCFLRRWESNFEFSIGKISNFFE